MQNNQKFANFLVEFNMLSSQVNWGDRTLRHRLKQALPDRIKDALALALVEDPATFAEWKRQVQSIDQRYWERQADIRRDILPPYTDNTNFGVPTNNQRDLPLEPPPLSTPVQGSMSTTPVIHHLTAQGGLTQPSGTDELHRIFACIVVGRDIRPWNVVRHGGHRKELVESLVPRPLDQQPPYPQTTS